MNLKPVQCPSLKKQKEKEEKRQTKTSETAFLEMMAGLEQRECILTDY